MNYKEYLLSESDSNKILELINNNIIDKKIYNNNCCEILSDTGIYILKNNKYYKITKEYLNSIEKTCNNCVIYINDICESFEETHCIPIIHTKIYKKHVIYKYDKLEIHLEDYPFDKEIKQKMYITLKNNKKYNKSKVKFNKMRDNYDAKRTTKFVYNGVDVIEKLLNS